MVGEGLAPPVLPEFLLRRIFARPAPGKCLAARVACRSSGGECEPDSARLRRAERGTMKVWRLQRTKKATLLGCFVRWRVLTEKMPTNYSKYCLYIGSDFNEIIASFSVPKKEYAKELSFGSHQPGLIFSI